MGRVCLTLLMAVVAGVCLAPASAQSFDFSGVVSTLADNVIQRLYVNQEITLLDHYCVLQRSPHFYRWELKWRATLTCPGWTPIIGKVSGYASPNSAEREATKDFVRKAVDSGLVTREDAKEWL